MQIGIDDDSLDGWGDDAPLRTKLPFGFKISGAQQRRGLARGELAQSGDHAPMVGEGLESDQMGGGDGMFLRAYGEVPVFALQNSEGLAGVFGIEPGGVEISIAQLVACACDPDLRLAKFEGSDGLIDPEGSEFSLDCTSLFELEPGDFESGRSAQFRGAHSEFADSFDGPIVLGNEEGRGGIQSIECDESSSGDLFANEIVFSCGGDFPDGASFGDAALDEDFDILGDHLSGDELSCGVVPDGEEQHAETGFEDRSFNPIPRFEGSPGFDGELSLEFPRGEEISEEEQFEVELRDPESSFATSRGIIFEGVGGPIPDTTTSGGQGGVELESHLFVVNDEGSLEEGVAGLDDFGDRLGLDPGPGESSGSRESLAFDEPVPVIAISERAVQNGPAESHESDVAGVDAFESGDVGQQRSIELSVGIPDLISPGDEFFSFRGGDAVSEHPEDDGIEVFVEGEHADLFVAGFFKLVGFDEGWSGHGPDSLESELSDQLPVPRVGNPDGIEAEFGEEFGGFSVMGDDAEQGRFSIEEEAIESDLRAGNFDADSGEFLVMSRGDFGDHLAGQRDVR